MVTPRRWAGIVRLCVLLLVAACDIASAELMQPKSIAEVLDDHVDQLMSIPGVSGVGIGDCSGRPCIKVFVVEKTPGVTGQIPARLNGYEVAIEETGEFRAPRPLQ
jgi:hypothetical protein